MDRQKKQLLKLLIATIVLVILCLSGVWSQRLRIESIRQNEVDLYTTAGTVVISLMTLFVILVMVQLFDMMYNYDILTTIHNADWIIKTGGMLHARKKLVGHTCVFLNIKDCKYINQKIGNKNGDKVLQDYAIQLERYVRGKGYIGRMGGDNFLIFIKNEELNRFLDFCRKLQVGITIEGESEFMSIYARAGIYTVKQDVEYRDIINRCAAALAIGKNQNEDFVFFEDAMLKKMVEDKEILLQCKQAIKNEEMLPYYQPKVNAATNMLCGAEALVRWQKGTELVPPMKFIPVLEQDGYVTQLDFYVFEYVCKDIRNWLDRGMTPVRVSVNFSKLHLKDPDFAEHILEIVEKYGVNPRYLEVELTESSCSEDYDILKAFSAVMKEHGIRLSIDDFGTGYSSLSMLKSCNADVIKLDKSFLDSAMTENSSSQLFIKDIIRMIKNQQEEILCEGVETQEQLQFLKDAGCDVIQGYLFDKPLPKKEFEERLKNPKFEREKGNE